MTKRAEMRRTPPDVLVTNYKMLDLLLQRDRRPAAVGGRRPRLRGARRVPHLRRRAGHRRGDAAAPARRGGAARPEGRWGRCARSPPPRRSAAGAAATASGRSPGRSSACPSTRPPLIGEDRYDADEFVTESTSSCRSRLRRSWRHSADDDPDLTATGWPAKLPGPRRPRPCQLGRALSRTSVDQGRPRGAGPATAHVRRGHRRAAAQERLPAGVARCVPDRRSRRGAHPVRRRCCARRESGGARSGRC